MNLVYKVKPFIPAILKAYSQSRNEYYKLIDKLPIIRIMYDLH